MKRRKTSWAKRQGVSVGKLGDTAEGIHITEENRATVYEYTELGIKALLEFQRNNYTNKGVKSVLYGVPGAGHRPIKYAVFCQDGFIKNVE